MSVRGVGEPIAPMLRLRSRLARWLPRGWRHRVPIAYGNDRLQRAQLFLPPAHGFPVVVCIYGSFWHFRYDHRWAPIAALLRAEGFGAIVVRHRLWPPDPWPAPVEDLAALLAWVRAHIAAFGGRPDRIALLGHSSGAQLALLVALDHRFLAARGVETGIVRSIVALGPPVDLVPRGDGRAFGDVLVNGCAAEVFAGDAAVMESASPRTHVRAAMPPIRLVLGEQDLPGLALDAERFRAQCEAAGGRAQLVRARGRDHMGLLPALVEDDDLRRDVIRFLRETTS